MGHTHGDSSTGYGAWVAVGEDGYDARQRGLELARHAAASGNGTKGLKIGVVREGFGQYDSQPDVDASVRAAAKVYEGLGVTVTDGSIPGHLHGLLLWGAIALDGG